MSFITKIADFFHGAAVKVSELFVKLFGKDAATAFGHDALIILKSDLGKIATAVVQEIKNAGTLAGEAARSEAFKRIVTAATGAGIDAKTSIVNLLIELAVNAISGHFSPAA